jgi:hypothetical protein
MPLMPFSGWSAFSASEATSPHVGFFGIFRPSFSKTSLRYMRNDDSP